MKTLGILTLSADPITKGHLWLIRAAHHTFDTVNVMISHNSEKKYLIPTQERMLLTDAAIDEYFGDTTDYARIGVYRAPEEQFAVTYLKSMEEHYDSVSFVRGIRNTTDMEYEKNMLEINRLVCPDLSVTYLIPPASLNHISSSAVKGMYKLDSWDAVADHFVTENVKRFLKRMAN
jgi:pantetheine-phosphate adenylyltransferase